MSAAEALATEDGTAAAGPGRIGGGGAGALRARELRSAPMRSAICRFSRQLSTSCKRGRAGPFLAEKVIGSTFRKIQMRAVLMVMAFSALSSCKPGPVISGQSGTVQAAGSAMALQFYDRRVPKAGEVLTPPVLLRLSGTLEKRRDCLVIRNGGVDHALVFETGTAEFDSASQTLKVGSGSFGIGGPISVGGPFNQPAETFDPAVVKSRCGVDNLWLVTATDVRREP